MNAAIDPGTLTDRELVVRAAIAHGAAWQAACRGDRPLAESHTADRDACLTEIRARSAAKTATTRGSRTSPGTLARFPIGDAVEWGW